jgi:hypothetical protein
MRPSYRAGLLVVLCIALGFGLAGILGSRAASAEQSAAVRTTRFQISAFAGATGQGVSHGAYVLDTLTGKTWHVRAGGEPVTVAEKLP